VLEYKDQDLITLREELSIIDNYYKLQKKRYGDNLQLDIEKLEEDNNIMVPPLTLQLLIENAIKHNIVSKDYPLKIRIFTDLKEQYLFVENNLQPKKEEVQSTGIGINNIVDRYHLLSGREIQISKTESSFTVGLPFIYQGKS
jgi:LytS/YehU family sensor histidine kinase